MKVFLVLKALTHYFSKIFLKTIKLLLVFFSVWFFYSFSAQAQFLELESSSVTAKRDQPEVSVFIRRSAVDIAFSPLPPLNNVEKIETATGMDIFDLKKK